MHIGDEVNYHAPLNSKAFRRSTAHDNRKEIFMDIIKSLTDNIDKIYKYIPFAGILFCVSVSSFAIYFLHIDNIYFTIAVYSGSLFIDIITTYVIEKIEAKYIKKKMFDSKWLTKIWNTLSKNEKVMLKAMYKSDKAMECEMNNRTALLLQQRGMIACPMQRSDGAHIMYIMYPWVEKMVAENK